MESFVILTSVVIGLVYFVSGDFQYYAIAMASGSMKPTFDRGSVVAFNKSVEIMIKS